MIMGRGEALFLDPLIGKASQMSGAGHQPHPAKDDMRKQRRG
jgi:hypothetical protein